jgi:hypothetical protein
MLCASRRSVRPGARRAQFSVGWSRMQDITAPFCRRLWCRREIWLRVRRCVPREGPVRRIARKRRFRSGVIGHPLPRTLGSYVGVVHRDAVELSITRPAPRIRDRLGRRSEEEEEGSSRGRTTTAECEDFCRTCNCPLIGIASIRSCMPKLAIG